MSSSSNLEHVEIVEPVVKFMKKMSRHDSKILHEYSLTNFEKVIVIMMKIKNMMYEFKVSKEIIQEIDWVVDHIRDKSLFEVDIMADNEEILKRSKDNSLFHSYINMISNYSISDNFNRKKRIKRSNSLKKDIKNIYRKGSLEQISTKHKTSTKFNKKSIYSKELESLQTIEDDEMLPKEKKKLSSENVNEINSNRNIVDCDNCFEFKHDNNSVEIIEIDSEDKLHIKLEEQNIQILEQKKIGSPTRKRIDKDGNNNNNNININNNIDLIPELHSNEFNFNLYENIDIDNYDFDFSSTDFNIFKFADKVGRENVFGVIFENIIQKVEERYIEKDSLFSKINSNKLKNFIAITKNGYQSNLPYHNELHGVDVCQTLFSWFNFSGIAKAFDLGYLDIISTYTAGLVHDFKHPGFNNSYLLNTRNELAIIYNDKSILENFHVSETFKVILKEENNIFSEFTIDEYKDIRKRMIEVILSTDMAVHFKSVSILKGKMDYLEIKDGKNLNKLISNNSVFSDQQELINYIVHSADISHNVKEWCISEKWSGLIYEEFFNQGEMEKRLKMTVSMFCDRETTNIPKAQIGFIAAIICPTFELLIRLFPNFNKIINNINKNNENWENKLSKNNESSKNVQEVSKEVRKDDSKEISKESNKDVSKESSKESNTDVSKESSKDFK